MTLKKHNLSDISQQAIPNAGSMRIGVAVSRWNPEITGALLQGVMNTLRHHGVPDNQIRVYEVPGSFELPVAAALLAEDAEIDGIICLGCIIQGETRHFEFIAQAVANGITQLGINKKIPVVFGVLTTDTYLQAKERAGGAHGNKGDEAADAVLRMIELKKALTR